MRTSFVETLSELSRKNRSIYMLTADVGFSVFEKYREEFPEKFINAGISEANMVGVAAGLALSGKIPFLYSFAPFVTMRCFEQIRIDVCYQNLKVIFVGLGGGITYCLEGATHHAVEDIAVMRALPNMSVVCPGDPIETREAIKASLKHPGPIYIRIGKRGEPNIHKRIPKFKIGRALTLREGRDAAVIATGNMLGAADEAVNILRKEGISAGLISMHTVKPLDISAVRRAAERSRIIFTVEEHNITGGLGSAVAESLSDMGIGTKLVRLALPDSYVKKISTQSDIRKSCNLDPAGISGEIKRALSRL